MSIHIPRHVRAVIDPDGAVLLDLRRGKYFSLNRLGVSIWQQLETGVPPSTIEESLASTHRQPLETVQADINDFLTGLAQAGLIEIHD